MKRADLVIHSKWPDFGLALVLEVLDYSARIIWFDDLVVSTIDISDYEVLT